MLLFSGFDIVMGDDFGGWMSRCSKQLRISVRLHVRLSDNEMVVVGRLLEGSLRGYAFGYKCPDWAIWFTILLATDFARPWTVGYGPTLAKFPGHT